MKNISFIIPSRNNLVYLKWCYNSIRKNLNPNHEICIADDASIDGTLEWLKETSKTFDVKSKYTTALNVTIKNKTVLIISTI